jgi:photosystem II stability/assembly factor-like uncharacterized protein
LAGGLRRSVDGGATWAPEPTSAAGAGGWFQVATTADGRGVWTGSSAGEVLRSLDGGASWQALAAPSLSRAVEALAPLPDGRVWLTDAGGGIALQLNSKKIQTSKP